MPDVFKQAFVMADNYRIAFAFRSVQLGGATQEDAFNYSKKLRMYYLSEAANPPRSGLLIPLKCDISHCRFMTTGTFRTFTTSSAWSLFSHATK